MRGIAGDEEAKGEKDQASGEHGGAGHIGSGRVELSKNTRRRRLKKRGRPFRGGLASGWRGVQRTGLMRPSGP